MRVLTVMGALVFSASAAFGGYLVELDGGDRMTVDSYWQDGDRMHLVRGGVDLSVPRSRVRSLNEVQGTAEAAAPEHAQPSAPAPRTASAEPDRKELQSAQRRIEHHLLRVQQERFEADARGEKPKAMKRLDREFKRTQLRRHDVIQKLRNEPVS